MPMCADWIQVQIQVFLQKIWVQMYVKTGIVQIMYVQVYSLCDCDYHNESVLRTIFSPNLEKNMGLPKLGVGKKDILCR